MFIVTNAGLASAAPNSLSSTAACKSKDCLSGRPLKGLIFPGPRCKRGALGPLLEDAGRVSHQHPLWLSQVLDHRGRQVVASLVGTPHRPV